MPVTIAIVLAGLQVLVFVMACTGNAIVIIAFWKYLKRSVVTNRFIVNLAVADMFTGLAAMSQLTYIIRPEINDNLYACLMRYQVVIFMTLTSQLTVTFTTFDRFVAICFPCKYKGVMTSSVANTLIVVSWVYPAILSILPFVGLNAWSTHLTCVFQQIVSPWLLLLMALTLWIFTVVTVAMYALILRKACALYKKVQPRGRAIQALVTVIHVKEVNDDCRPTHQRQQSMANTERSSKMASVLRGAKALAAVTLLFSICWLPYTYFEIRVFVDPEYKFSDEWNVATWLVFLGMANSIMNPFIYAWQRKDFNQACKRLICCKAPFTGLVMKGSNKSTF